MVSEIRRYQPAFDRRRLAIETITLWVQSLIRVSPKLLLSREVILLVQQTGNDQRHDLAFPADSAMDSGS